MRTFWFFLVFFMAIFCRLQAQNIVTTNDGKKIIFYDDGTWKYLDQLSLPDAPTVLPAPPFVETPGKDSGKPMTLKLEKLTSTPLFKTDDQEWFSKNGINYPYYTVPNSFMGIKGNCPDPTPTSYKGKMLVRAIKGEKYNYLVYGNNYSEGNILAITDGSMKTVLYTIDFSTYQNSPADVPSEKAFSTQSIHWAVIEDQVLYVSTGHRTYAASSGGLNAYITAIDLNTMTLLWRSSPLVSNAENFEIIGNAIISGYGFTAEPDFLYIINKSTGKVAEKITLKTSPSYIIHKGDKVLVQTYDTDYTFLVK
jgi:hypothetical protein